MAVPVPETQQEKFFVPESKNPTGYKPTGFRHFLAPDRGLLLFGEQKYTVLNYSPHGLLIRAPNPLSESSYQNIKFVLDGQLVAEIDLARMRTEQESERSFLIAFSLIKGTLDVIPKTWVVRQERFDTTKKNFSIQVGTKSYPVINYSAFGLLVQGDENLVAADSWREIPLKVDDTEITKLDLRKAREEFGQDGVKIAFESTNGPIALSRINALMKSIEIKNEMNQILDKTASIPKNFRLLVLEMKTALEALERKVNNVQDTVVFESTSEWEHFETAFVENIAHQLVQIFDVHGADLETIVAPMQELAKKACFEYFRQTLSSILYQSPFAHRSYFKPRGYAGDAEMMKMLYRNEKLGKSLFAKCLHRYYMNHPNAKAVRNRREYLRESLLDFLAKKTNGSSPSILSVACGPAEEIQQLITNHSHCLKDVSFHLLDQDLHSLGDAQLKIMTACIGKKLDFSVVYIHKAIRNLLTESHGPRYDMIYSAGLFDYFNNSVAFKAAQRLYDRLLPGGKLVIGNFNGGANVRAIMDLALDWQLIYRSPTDMQRLYSPINPSLRIESEKEEINLFAILTKPLLTVG